MRFVTIARSIVTNLETSLETGRRPVVAVIRLVFASRQVGISVRNPHRQEITHHAFVEPGQLTRLSGLIPFCDSEKCA